MSNPMEDPTPSAAPTSSSEGEDRMIGLEEIGEIEERSYKVIRHLSKQFQHNARDLALRFTTSQTAQMVGRSVTAIRDAEAREDTEVEAPPRNEKGRRTGYTLAQVNKLRAHFGTLPWRDPRTDEPIRLAVQNFKGGCGKSTLTTHLAQAFALDGYRVCVIDCDPQGSTTALFGLNPDEHVQLHDTLYPFLLGEEATAKYCLRKTHWDQLYLIPANLSLYQAEYVIAARAAGREDAGSAQLLRLRQAIDTIAADFDVILIDPPPALGMIPLNVLNAANALVVPVRPATIDFASTAHFFTMLKETYETLGKYGVPEPRFKFLKVLTNDFDEGKSVHKAIASMMQTVYGTAMLSTVMKDSAEIDNAGARLLTVYELDKPITSRTVHQRCMAYLNATFREIETLVRKTWPSHHEALRKEGLL